MLMQLTATANDVREAVLNLTNFLRGDTRNRAAERFWGAGVRRAERRLAGARTRSPRKHHQSAHSPGPLGGTHGVAAVSHRIAVQFQVAKADTFSAV